MRKRKRKRERGKERGREKEEERKRKRKREKEWMKEMMPLYFDDCSSIVGLLLNRVESPSKHLRSRLEGMETKWPI